MAVEDSIPSQPGWEEPLLSRLSRGAPLGLEAYLEQGGLVGAQRAQRYSRTEALTELRASGLRERGPWALPLYLVWQQFLEQPGPGVLVVQAQPADPRSLAERALLEGNPYLLIEGLMIAGLVTGVQEVQVLLGPGLTDLGPAVRQAWERIKAWDPLEGEGPELALGFPSQAPAAAGGVKALAHNLETWCQLPLLMSWGAGWYSGLGQGGQGGTRLLTVGGRVAGPGLVEAPMGASLWQVIEAAGGLLDQDVTNFLGLSLDAGLGGFLSLEAAATPLDPEELAGLGCAPMPSTVWVLGRGECLVQETADALERLADGRGPALDQRALSLTLRALELTRQAARGEACPPSLPGPDRLQAVEGLMGQLQDLAWSLKALSAPAARPLLTSLNQFGPEWAEHLAGRGCPAR